MDAFVNRKRCRSAFWGGQSVVNGHTDRSARFGEQRPFAIRSESCSKTRVRIRVDRIVSQLNKASFLFPLGSCYYR